MNFMDSIKTCFSKYFDFSGRARRSEFWWYYLFFVLVGIIPFVGIVVTLAGLIPYIAVATRRLHDTDRSGWWQLAPAIPLVVGGGIMAAAFASGGGGDPNTVLAVLGGLGILIGAILGIVLIVWLATDTVPGPNRFGPSPK